MIRNKKHMETFDLFGKILEIDWTKTILGFYKETWK